MGAVEDYRARREARIADKKAQRIEDYKVRRTKRLLVRGTMPFEYRVDAPEEEIEQNKYQARRGEGSSGGSHGNTKLPFGLCMRFGIEIGKDWTPRDAWDALADKGITPESAYAKIKKGEDPGMPDSPEPPKEPVKKIKVKTYSGEAEYDGLRGEKIRWARRGDEPWRLYGDRVEGSYEDKGWRTPSARMSERFMTKTDMLRYLKEKGVEEFEDPETGELLNPKEMELPIPDLTIGKTGYTNLAIGLRDGNYVITGKDFDGKTKEIEEFVSLGAAQKWLSEKGAKAEGVKISPAVKKREKERLSWLSSDKKEYFEDGGVKYGDIMLVEGYSDWTLTGESEDGEIKGKDFGTRAEAMRFLKEQGVKKVKEGSEFLDPTEYEVPDTVARIEGKDYQEIGLDVDPHNGLIFYGYDLDGKRRSFRYKFSESYEAFLDRIKSIYGVSEDSFTITDSARAEIEKIKKEDEEKARRKKEFEAKAIPWGRTGSKFVDIEIGTDDYGHYSFYGYDERGDRKKISHSGDMYDLKKAAELSGYKIEDFIKDKKIKEEYDRYAESVKDFEAKATDFAGEKFADISIDYDGWNFTVRGIDERGRKREIANESSYESLEKLMNNYGYSPTQFSMSKEAMGKMDRAIKAKNAIATGGYYSFGVADEAFKDIKVSEEVGGGMWDIYGTDIDGKEKMIRAVGDWDEAVSTMGKYGVSDYKIKDRSGTELGKPTWGMHKIMLMRKPGGGFIVYADSDRFGKHAVMYETPKEEEARKWLRENNVPETGIKTRGMNPNDDVVRTHTAKSLSNFDIHRAEATEGSFIEDMTKEEKQKTADMLTEIFDKGAVRVARSPSSFGGIIENGYKSQIETGTGGKGAYIGARRRKAISDQMYGHGGIGDTEYEKCGYLGYADEAEDYRDSSHPFYGEITYTLKKDRLKDRMTYTWGDSLNSDGHLRSAGYGGEHPTIEGMTALYGVSYVRDALEEYQKYKDGKISYSEMFKRIRDAANNEYIELQFHGPVTVEDIEKVSFQKESDLKKAFDKMSPDRRKSVIKKLKDNNVGLIYSTEKGRPFQDAWKWVEEHYPDDMPS